MTTINIYLTFNGECETAFNFYRSVFGGEFQHVGRYKEMPAEYKVKPEEAERIMHVSLPVSEETILMGSDTGGDWAAHYKQGNNFAISINTDSKEKADDFFGKLSEGGRVTMPMQNTFWGDYFGNLTDKFGINWMVSFNENPQK